MKGKNTGVLPVKYRYFIKNSLFIKIIDIIGLITSLFMLTGLVILSLNYIVYFLIFLPLILTFLFYYSTHYIFNLYYNKFSLPDHKSYIKKYWNNGGAKPSVDILIPYSGEGLEIISETCKAALNIVYENKKIFLLDDSGDDHIKKVMEEMGINYLRRPDRGHMKKAGNLTYGINHSTGDFIAIFDADFVPERDFLMDLLPYFSDSKIGIVQSPQFFVSQGRGLKKNLITAGGAALQEDFYKIIQPSRNPFHGAICVGTNLIYRRSSLIKAGGIAYVPWCEDLETGFNITASGNYLLYLPIILAKGRSPDNPQSYFNQHRRWCYSSLRLLFSRKMFLSKMKFSTRLSYISNIFYYFSEAFSILAVLIFSLILLFAGSLIDTRYFIFFLPFLAYVLFLQPFTRSNKTSLGSYIISALDSFSYLYTIIAMLISRKFNWIPSNTRERKISLHFGLFLLMSGLIIAVEAYSVINALFINLKIITFRQWSTYPFLGWFLMIILTQVSLYLYILNYVVRTFLFKSKREG